MVYDDGTVGVWTVRDGMDCEGMDCGGIDCGSMDCEGI